MRTDRQGRFWRAELHNLSQDAHRHLWEDFVRRNPASLSRREKRQVYRRVYRATHISLVRKAVANPEQQVWTGCTTQEYNGKPLGTKYLEVDLQAWGPNWVRLPGFQSCFDLLIPHLYWHFRIQISECLLPACWMLTVLRNDHFPFGFESPKERERKLQELHRRTVSKDSQGTSPTETELRWLLNFKPSSSGSSLSSTLRGFFKID